MLVSFVESRPKKKGRSDVWEDVLIARLEMATVPHAGWVVRVPIEQGWRRYRVREICTDLPDPASKDRVTELQVTVFVVAIPPSGTLETLPADRQVGLFENSFEGLATAAAGGH